MKTHSRLPEPGKRIIDILESQHFSCFDTKQEATEIRRKMMVQFKDGTPLLQKNEAGNCFFVIIQGSVIAVNDHGKILACLTSGAVIGEISFLSGLPRTCNVIAQGDVMALKLDRENMEQLDLFLQIEIQEQLIQVLVHRFIEKDTAQFWM
ncbi:MAG: cyclic nucleotide-binding domain-containing protein [Magnetococcus sp. YQC-5]